MTINRTKDPERVAECSRLITEIQDFQSELNEWETNFIASLETNIGKWGEATFITDKQYQSLQTIYEKVC